MYIYICIHIYIESISRREIGEEMRLVSNMKQNYFGENCRLILSC